MHRTTLVLTSLLLATPLLTGAAVAQDDAGFDGQIRLGFRSVSNDGSEEKFREDFDLDDGPRLFELRLGFSPEGESKGFDRAVLDVSNLGGDPFETIDFSLDKFGTYRFQLQRRESTYFYEDQLIPKEDFDVSLSSGGDFHHFDFERVHDRALLEVTPNRAAKLYFGFDRFTKRGESTTTLDIQRDEFELDRPIEESSNEYRVGLEYSWPKVTVVFEETVRDYENLVEIFAPGATEGENTTNAANLDFFFLDQPYELEGNTHLGRIIATPMDRLRIVGSILLQEDELDVSATERSAGTGFNGSPFTTDLSGSGEISRDVERLEVDLTYLINDRVALVGGIKQQSLDQEGDFSFGGDLNLGEWDIETTSTTAGVQFSPDPKLTLTGGVRLETREVEHAAGVGGLGILEEEETDQTGVFATVGWRPKKGMSLTLDVENSSYDDPFTLASPTDRQRIRLSGRARLAGNWSLNGSFVFDEIENDNSGWTSDSDQLSLRVAYQADGLSFSAGYGFFDVERAIDQEVVTLPGFGGGVVLFFPILYEADTDFLDGRVRWQPAPGWTLGADCRFYDNSGSFALERTDIQGYVEKIFDPGYLLRLGYRDVDYEEVRFNFDDYTAEIFEVSVGYRW